LLAIFGCRGEHAVAINRSPLHYLLTELITGAISVVVFAYLTSAAEPLALNDAAFFKTLAGTFALFWWLIAIVATGRQDASNVSSLWQSFLWLGLLANLDGQYCPLPEAVGLACTAHAIGMLSLHWVTQQQDRSRLFFLGLAAGLAWFGSVFLLPLALTILGAGTVRLGATIGRFANNESSAELKLRTDQNVVAYGHSLVVVFKCLAHLSALGLYRQKPATIQN
jgi:hypothetical protein